MVINPRPLVFRLNYVTRGVSELVARPQSRRARSTEVWGRYHEYVNHLQSKSCLQN